jgi:hypothetical protein
MFGGGAKFDFAEKNALNSASTYILASCRIDNSLRSGLNLVPTDAAQRVLNTGDTEAFKRSFGDRFCQALRTGGEFHAIVRVTSSNVNHQSDVATSLHGEMNNLLASGSFKASLDLARADRSSHTEVAIDIVQMGGQGNQIQMPGAEADKIREVMQSFAISAHEHPVAFEAELVTYDTLALPGPSAEENADRRDVLMDCLTRKHKYWSAISELDFLLTDGAQKVFEDVPSLADLATLQNAFRNALGELMTYARNVSIGIVPAIPFVPTAEPVLPRLVRRKVQVPQIAGRYSLVGGDRIVFIMQDESSITCHDPDQFFDHHATGTWNGAFFDYNVDRQNRENGCITTMFGRLFALSDGSLKHEVLGTDGKCDLPPTFVATAAWKKTAEVPQIAGRYSLVGGDRIVVIMQDESSITCHDPDQFFDHHATGTWNGAFFDYNVDRQNKENGCITTMFGRLFALLDGSLKHEVLGTDGKCDLPSTFVATAVWKKTD